MSIPTNSIGDFQFIALDGQPELIRQEIELVFRRGVNGAAFWRTGERGRPFRLRSRVDAQSKADAQALYATYKQLVGADPVTLVWSGLDYELRDGVQVVVVDVTQADCRSLAATGGTGLNPPSLGWLECDWELMAVVKGVES